MKEISRKREREREGARIDSRVLPSGKGKTRGKRETYLTLSMVSLISLDHLLFLTFSFSTSSSSYYVSNLFSISQFFLTFLLQSISVKGGEAIKLSAIKIASEYSVERWRNYRKLHVLEILRICLYFLRFSLWQIFLNLEQAKNYLLYQSGLLSHLSTYDEIFQNKSKSTNQNPT